MNAHDYYEADKKQALEDLKKGKSVKYFSPEYRMGMMTTFEIIPSKGYSIPGYDVTVKIWEPWSFSFFSRSALKAMEHSELVEKMLLEMAAGNFTFIER